MEYAIIKANGKKVSVNETSERGLVYICPYCGEECLTLNIGYKSSWFSHPKKVDRTPLEKTCPEYKEADKVIDDVSRLYIKNGGVPVYLHKNESRFYIDAIFPQLSLQSLELLKGAKIKVDRQLYNVTNRSGIIYHRLDNINTKWINVSIADNRKTNPEIKQKWLCGIMGLNKLEQSIFQCNANGGYRISHNNHVFVGQKYYIISGSQNIGKVPGIENLGALFVTCRDMQKSSKIRILEQHTKIRLRCFWLSFCTLSGQIADKKHSTYPCTYSFLTDVQIISADKMSVFLWLLADTSER